MGLPNRFFGKKPNPIAGTTANDSSYDVSLRRRLWDAVSLLATAPGPLRNRVFDAYEQYLSPLRADDFTLELRPSVEKLHHDIVAIVDRSKREKSPYYLQRCGAFEAAKAYLGTGHLNPQLAQALAKLICDLYIKVERGPSVAVILPDPRRNTVL